MAKSRQDVVGVNCAKDANGKVLVENDQVKEVWRKYMEKLLNENTWDNATTREKIEGPCELSRRDEILKSPRMMKTSKASILHSLDLCQGKEILMQSSLYDRCSRNVGVKEKLYFAFVDLEKSI